MVCWKGICVASAIKSTGNLVQWYSPTLWEADTWDKILSEKKFSLMYIAQRGEFCVMTGMGWEDVCVVVAQGFISLFGLHFLPPTSIVDVSSVRNK